MFAGYEVGRIIGRGAMGVVYQAHDPKLGRDVALKVVAEHLAQDEAFRARFAQEAKSAARVEHPGVVAIYQTGEEDGIPFLVMRLVRGRELSAILGDRGKLPLAEALRLLTPIAGGLDAAHAANIVHRDVKPANILVPDDGSDPVLVDFGIGRVMQGTRATQTGSWVGTVDYVAPEQIRGGDVDGRADQYALGCVLYEMIVGEPPFRREDTIQSLFAHANDAPPLIVTGDAVADARLNEVVTRALAKDPAVRFASCADLVAVAAGVVAAEGVAQVSSRTGTVIAPSPVGPTGTVVGDGRAAEPASSPPVREVATKPSKTKFVVLGLVVAVLAVGGVGGYIVFASGSGSSTDASAVEQTTATSPPASTAIDPALVKLRALFAKYRAVSSSYETQERTKWDSANSQWEACDASGDSECTWVVWTRFAAWKKSQENRLSTMIQAVIEQAAVAGRCNTGNPFGPVLGYHTKMGSLQQELIDAFNARDNTRVEAVRKRIQSNSGGPLLGCNP
jgi:serine/threonine protein kinase